MRGFRGSLFIERRSPGNPVGVREAEWAAREQARMWLLRRSPPVTSSRMESTLQESLSPREHGVKVLVVN